MSVIDDHLRKIEDPLQREALEHVRKVIRRVAPGAEEVISYGIPAFKYKGKAIGGFDAYKKHLSYFPWGSAAINELKEEFEQFEQTKGSIHFTPEKPLPDSVIEKLVRYKMHEVDAQTDE